MLQAPGPRCQPLTDAAPLVRSEEGAIAPRLHPFIKAGFPSRDRAVGCQAGGTGDLWGGLICIF